MTTNIKLINKALRAKNREKAHLKHYKLKSCKLKSYKVTWVIDIDAESPEEAASVAQTVQRDRNSTANVFYISDESNKEVIVDLDLHELSDTN